MRHQMSAKKLNRPVGHRQAMLKNLLSQLYMHEAIVTTQAKALTVKALADRMIHQAKPQTITVRRQLSRTIKDPQVLKKLVDDIALRYTDLSSGFTRTIRLGARQGDNAMMVRLELTRQQPAVKPEDTKQKPAKKIAKSATQTTSGSSKKSSSKTVTRKLTVKKSVTKKSATKPKTKSKSK